MTAEQLLTQQVQILAEHSEIIVYGLNFLAGLVASLVFAVTFRV